MPGRLQRAQRGTRVTVNGFTAAVPYGQSIPMTFSFAERRQLTLNVADRDPGRAVRPTGATVKILPPHPTPIWEEGQHGEQAAEGDEIDGCCEPHRT